MHLYEAYGLVIRSFIPFPELIDADAIRSYDIDIQQRPLTNFPLTEQDKERQFYRSGRDAYFYWRSVGKFLARQGGEIVADPHPDTPLSLIRQAILGPILATALQQKGLLVLHANAVEINGNGVIIAGLRGHGKSTLAAALHHRGHRILADDVAAIKFNEENLPVIPAGCPRLKLWPDALSAMGDDPSKYGQLWPTTNKRHLPLTADYAATETSLRRIYVLQGGPEPKIKPVHTNNALMLLIAHSYATLYGQAWLAPEVEQHFQQCAQTAKVVPVYCLQRPHDHDFLEQTAILLEKQNI